MTEHPTASEVVRIIADAFDGIPRDDGVSLHEAEVIDCYGNAAERIAARDLDTEACWQDVPQNDIETFSSALSFLDAKGFHYYAPAYMRWTILHGRESASASSDSIVYHLLRLREADAYHRERFALLTYEQKRAIAMFIGYMSAEDEDCQEAFHDYWNQFV